MARAGSGRLLGGGGGGRRPRRDPADPPEGLARGCRSSAVTFLCGCPETEAQTREAGLAETAMSARPPSAPARSSLAKVRECPPGIITIE